MEPVFGAVLAGGESRRMGRDKALLRFEGRGLAARAVTVLAEVLGDVTVVGRLDEADSPPGVPVVPDLRPGLGPLGGIHTALRLAPGRPVFVLACDLPRVGPELVSHLISVAAAARRTGSTVFYAALGDDRQPLCGVWSGACVATVEEALDRGHRSVTRLVAGLDATVVELTPDLPFFRPDLLANLNRPGDLAALGADPGDPRRAGL